MDSDWKTQRPNEERRKLQCAAIMNINTCMPMSITIPTATNTPTAAKPTFTNILTATPTIICTSTNTTILTKAILTATDTITRGITVPTIIPTTAMSGKFTIIRTKGRFEGARVRRA